MKYGARLDQALTANKAPAPSTLPLRSVLEQSGFDLNWAATYAEEQPGYCFNFGDLSLKAIRVTNEYLRPVFHFGGVWSTPRRHGMIDFDMPMAVESFEQGVAWIVDALQRHGYTPPVKPTWYLAGEAHRGLLPLERRRAEYEARPQCLVDRDFLRPAIRRLRAQAANASPAEIASISFDGEILRFRISNMPVAVSAVGTPWPESYAVAAIKLQFLPKRLMDEQVFVSVLNGRLSIGRSSFDIVEPANAQGE